MDNNEELYLKIFNYLKEGFRVSAYSNKLKRTIIIENAFPYNGWEIVAVFRPFGLFYKMSKEVVILKCELYEITSADIHGFTGKWSPDLPIYTDDGVYQKIMK